MAKEKTLSDKVLVLSDDPLYRAESSGDDFDAFDHTSYARALLRVLTDNSPPLVVGLFGSWGIGKSTVVNKLFSLIRESKLQELRPIYFNAWKYSGDSFRRQFLIEVARQVYEGDKDQARQILRLEQLNYTDVLKNDKRRGLVETLREAFHSTIQLRQQGVARVILGMLVLVMAFAYGLFPEIRNTLVYAFLLLLLVFFFKMRFEELVIVEETPLYDPKLIFPEQFESEFKSLVRSDGPLGTAKAVIAIDDIDRCDPYTVKDILTSIKMFVGEHNCFFLVPCDDKTIVDVFTEPNQKAGYKDEMLRKDFNVGVRIAPLMDTDLADLANFMSKESGIPQAVVQMAILANCRDARKLKHFLNTFIVKYAVAKERQQQGFIPTDIDGNLAGFAKAVLIEDLFPELFAKMVRNPRIFEQIEQQALQGLIPSSGEFGSDLERKEYVELMEILQKTRDTKIENLEVVLSLKTSNLESRIPQGVALKNAIISGSETAAQDMIGKITKQSERTDLASLLVGLLESQTETFLKNAITASLRVWSQEGFVSDSDKKRVASAVCYALSYEGEQKVLRQQVPQVLKCAKEVGVPYPDVLARKIHKEISNLSEIPESFADVVNALYPSTPDRHELAELLNEKFVSWLDTEKGLSALLSFDFPIGESIPEQLPSLSLLLRVANGMGSADTEATISLNKLRMQIFGKYWGDLLSSALAERFLAILQEAKSDENYTPRIAFVLESIIDKPECLESEAGLKLLAPITALYGRISDAGAKFLSHKILLLFAVSTEDAATRNNAETAVAQQWLNFSEPRLREILQFLSGEDPRSAGLSKRLVMQEFSASKAELASPTDKTKQRIELCYDHQAMLDDGALGQFFIQTLDSAEAPFEVWGPVVLEYAAKLGPEIAQQLADKCLTLGVTSVSLTKRQGLFNLFGGILPLVTLVDKDSLLKRYFSACKHTDGAIRDAAGGILDAAKAGVELHDFRIGLNALVRDFCDIQPRQVIAYKKSLDGALKYAELFEEYTWRDLAALSKRLIEETDASLQSYGVSLITGMPKIPKAEEEDIIQLLVNVAQGDNGPLRGEAEKMLKRLSSHDLNDDARKTLDGFMKNKGEVTL